MRVETSFIRPILFAGALVALAAGIVPPAFAQPLSASSSAAQAVTAQSAPAWDAVPLAVGREQPDLVLKGSADRSDYQNNVSVPFDVPEGVTRIGIAYDYTRPDGKTVINLGLFDGKGFRGWSGSNKKTIVLDEASATPSYTAGPIGGQRWTVDLGVSFIGEGVTSEYTLKIWFWRAGDVPSVSTFSPEPLELERRWYRGDFHLHTGHSDGFFSSRRGRKVPCPLYRTADAARAARLDFAAITDHNNVALYATMRELQPFYDDLLMIPGREMTTEQGHANIFGTTQYIDHRLGEETMPDMASMIQASHDAGALVSVNHPAAPTDHSCRGCGWGTPNPTYAMVDMMEVMNSSNILKQLGGEDSGRDLAMWDQQLQNGRRITAIGGSDNHDVEMGRLGVGLPITMVLADQLSERAILDAVKAGHVMIDLTGKMDLGLDLTARSAERSGHVGDNFIVAKGRNLDIEMTITGAKGQKLVGFLDGKPMPAFSVDELTDAQQKLSFRWPSDGGRHWIRFELQSGKQRLFLTNPVYINFTS